MSFEYKTKKLKINEKNSINLISIVNLNLFIISDMNNFGSNWIQVSYCRRNQIYSTKSLLGTEDDTLSPICRYLAQTLIENIKCVDPSPDMKEDICFTFNISLKNTNIDDRQVVQKIGQNLI